MRAMVLISGPKGGDLRLQGREKGTRCLLSVMSCAALPRSVGPTNPRVCLVKVTGNLCRTSGNTLCDIPFPM
jgi:hypothetical protein